MLGGLAAAAGLAGQDQHTTQERYDAHTQVWVVLLELLCLAVCLAGAGFGAWLAVSPTLGVLESAAGLDLFLVAVGLSFVGGIATTLARAAVLRRQQHAFPLLLARSLALVWSWSATLAGLYLLLGGWQLVNRPAWEGDGDRAILVKLGVGLILAGVCALGAYRFAIEVWNPRYPRSPALGVLERLVGMVWGPDDDEEEDPGTLPAPWRVRGRLEGLVSAANGGGGKVHPYLYHLGAFLREGNERSFTRRSWLGEKENERVPLATGLEVGREEYDNLIGLGKRYGFLATQGTGTGWTPGVTLDVALETLAREADYIERGS